MNRRLSGLENRRTGSDVGVQGSGFRVQVRKDERRTLNVRR